MTNCHVCVDGCVDNVYTMNMYILIHIYIYRIYKIYLLTTPCTTRLVGCKKGSHLSLAPSLHHICQASAAASICFAFLLFKQLSLESQMSSLSRSLVRSFFRNLISSFIRSLARSLVSSLIRRFAMEHHAHWKWHYNLTTILLKPHLRT